ncbi:MAG: hypothetical protein JKY97_07815, partial [Citromicrobium sp.]|nr:hypothetical protein [Citromicrobium sp.]
RSREVVVARTYYVALALAQRGVGVTVVDEFTARNILDGEVGFYSFRRPMVAPVTAYFLDEKSENPLIVEFLETVERVLSSTDPTRA